MNVVDISFNLKFHFSKHARVHCRTQWLFEIDSGHHIQIRPLGTLYRSRYSLGPCQTWRVFFMFLYYGKQPASRLLGGCTSEFPQAFCSAQRMAMQAYVFARFTFADPTPWLCPDAVGSANVNGFPTRRRGLIGRPSGERRSILIMFNITWRRRLCPLDRLMWSRH